MLQIRTTVQKAWSINGRQPVEQLKAQAMKFHLMILLRVQQTLT